MSDKDTTAQIRDLLLTIGGLESALQTAYKLRTEEDLYLAKVLEQKRPEFYKKLKRVINGLPEAPERQRQDT